MPRFKEHLPILSVGAVVGAIIPALISLGIFATRADVAELKTEMYREFVSQERYDTKMTKIEKGLEKILELLYEEKKGNK